MIQHTYGKNTWTYYTEEEAQERGIEYEADWRNGVAGGHVLTDDGWVAPVVHNGRASHGTYPWVRIPTGTFLGYPKEKMTSEEREDRHSFLGKRTDYKNPHRRLTKNERRFVLFFLKTFDTVQAYWEVIEKKKDRTLPEAEMERRAYRYATQRANVRMAIEKGTEQILEKAGLTKEWWARKLKDTVESSERPIDALKGLELGAKVLGLTSGDSQDKGPHFFGIATREVELVAGERRELLDEAREVGGGTNGGSGATVPDEGGHGALREADVSEGAVQEDPAVSQRDL